MLKPVRAPAELIASMFATPVPPIYYKAVPRAPMLLTDDPGPTIPIPIFRLFALGGRFACSSYLKTYLHAEP